MQPITKSVIRKWPKKGGVKEVLTKHLLPFNPFVHQHFRHLGGGEEVFFANVGSASIWVVSKCYKV
jgi:hypothetical protein